MTYPDDWPPDCPPPDAELAAGGVFRLVTTNPPVAMDFRSYREIGASDLRWPCEAAGLSVFRDLSDAIQYSENFPARGRFVARGTLDGQHGRCKATPRKGPVGGSHTTWWPYAGVSRHTMFSVIRF